MSTRRTPFVTIAALLTAFSLVMGPAGLMVAAGPSSGPTNISEMDGATIEAMITDTSETDGEFVVAQLVWVTGGNSDVPAAPTNWTLHTWALAGGNLRQAIYTTPTLDTVDKTWTLPGGTTDAALLTTTLVCAGTGVFDHASAMGQGATATAPSAALDNAGQGKKSANLVFFGQLDASAPGFVAGMKGIASHMTATLGTSSSIQEGTGSATASPARDAATASASTHWVASTINLGDGSANACTVADADASKSLVVADPDTVPADGTTNSTITVTILDFNGAPLSGATVSLSSSRPALDSIGAPVPDTTDSNGNITFNVTSTTYGISTFTAQSGVVVIQDTADVNFTGIDLDGDGYFSIGSGGDDCDDDNADRFPGNPEVVGDGVDQDCDGFDLQRWYRDADSDLYGNQSDNQTSNTQPSGYVSDNTDCDDSDAGIRPNATDVPDNGVDENCSGHDTETFYHDGDSDTFGDPGDSTTTDDGTTPTDYVSDSTDCDDGNADRFPGNTEVPDDGVDQDCDGSDLLTWYRDADSDTFGNAEDSIDQNTQPSGYVSDNTDCDDGDDSIYPGASEVVGDGVDQDCDGSDLLQWFGDSDNDSFGDSSTTTLNNTQPSGYVPVDGDCNDDNASIYPGAPEVVGDGVDQDCDGSDLLQWFGDSDNDSFGDSSNTALNNTQPPGYVPVGGDCNDDNASIYPTAPEVANNGVDENCNGFDLTTYFGDNDGDTFGDASNTTDVDADEAPTGYVGDFADCDDDNASIYPNAPEVANNGVDENCNGFDLTTYFGDADGDSFGNASNSTDLDAADPPEGFVANLADCDDGNASIFPGAPDIPDDGVDQDCDGLDLATWFLDFDSDGYGNTSANLTNNTAPLGYVALPGDCNDANDTIYPGANETLGDGVDQDCDGFDLNVWFLDVDGDGFGNTSVNVTANLPPDGNYTVVGPDCDDGNPNVTIACTDMDGDGIYLEEGDCDDDNDRIGLKCPRRGGGGGGGRPPHQGDTDSSDSGSTDSTDTSGEPSGESLPLDEVDLDAGNQTGDLPGEDLSWAKATVRDDGTVLVTWSSDVGGLDGVANEDVRAFHIYRQPGQELIAVIVAEPSIAEYSFVDAKWPGGVTHYEVQPVFHDPAAAPHYDGALAVHSNDVGEEDSCSGAGIACWVWLLIVLAAVVGGVWFVMSRRADDN